MPRKQPQKRRKREKEKVKRGAEDMWPARWSQMARGVTRSLISL